MVAVAKPGNAMDPSAQVTWVGVFEHEPCVAVALTKTAAAGEVGSVWTSETSVVGFGPLLSTRTV